MGDAKKIDDAPGGDAAAAPPVEHRHRRERRPAAQAQLAQDMVPFPADAFAVGEIVIGEIGRSLPVGAVGGGAEKTLRRRSSASSRVRKSWRKDRRPQAFM